jgi:murein DD-endopeptidase MepM/ murein hydrolase activator NlpD
VPPKDFEPKTSPSPFAAGGPDLVWPIQTDNSKKVAVSYQDVRGKWHGKWGRHFATARKGDDGIRRHAGVDLFAHGGDVVLAMEDGEVLATLPFTDGTWAIYVRNDSGEIVNYGEVFKNSWKEFGLSSGVDTGQRVSRGQPIARVGVMGKDTSMLHLETIRGDMTTDDIRQGALRWFKGDPPPDGLLDPTQYLVRAQRKWFEDQMPPEPDGPLET